MSRSVYVILRDRGRYLIGLKQVMGYQSYHDRSEKLEKAKNLHCGLGHWGWWYKAFRNPRYRGLRKLMLMPNPGFWGFLGGHLDHGEDPKSGALREFDEEVCPGIAGGLLKKERLKEYHKVSAGGWTGIYYLYELEFQGKDEAVVGTGSDKVNLQNKLISLAEKMIGPNFTFYPEIHQLKWVKDIDLLGYFGKEGKHREWRIDETVKTVEKYKELYSKYAAKCTCRYRPDQHIISKDVDGRRLETWITTNEWPDAHLKVARKLLNDSGVKVPKRLEELKKL